MTKVFAYKSVTTWSNSDWDGEVHNVGLILPDRGVSLIRGAHYSYASGEGSKTNLFGRWTRNSPEVHEEKYKKFQRTLKGERTGIFGLKEIEIDDSDIENLCSDLKTIPFKLQGKLSRVVNDIYQLEKDEDYPRRDCHALQTFGSSPRIIIFYEPRSI
jgi:hypothetical protein